MLYGAMFLLGMVKINQQDLVIRIAKIIWSQDETRIGQQGSLSRIWAKRGSRPSSYTNCCSTSLKGWGKHLGARCTKNEIDLIDKRQKKLMCLCRERK